MVLYVVTEIVAALAFQGPKYLVNRDGHYYPMISKVQYGT